MTPGLLVFLTFTFLVGGAILQLLLGRFLTARHKGYLAFAGCISSFAAVVVSYLLVQRRGPLNFPAGLWDGPLSFVVHVDFLSLLFALMGTGIGAVILMYSASYMEKDKSATRFYALMLVFIAGLVGLVYAANLFFLYLCWELIGLCSFFLVGFEYKNREAVKGARKVLLMTHLGGYGLLIAILVIYARTGSALWTDPAVAHCFNGWIFGLMLLAIIAKSVQFPLHTWIADAMAAPTPVSALLHSACYVKAGVYLAVRMHCFGPWALSWSEAMIWIGTVTMVVGVAQAMIQSDLKRMLAFHTVSQIGYMIMGIGIGTPLAIAAALLHCLNHAFFKGGLFLGAGTVQRQAGTRDMNQLGGLGVRMPYTSAFWYVNAASIMGIPLTSGFVSKWLLYTAGLQAGQTVPVLIAWLVSIGTVYSFSKATSVVFLGPASEQTRNAHEAPKLMLVAMGLMATASAVLGVAPQLAIRFLVNPVLAVSGMANPIAVSWLGISTSSGGWLTSYALILAAITAGLALALYALRAHRARTSTPAQELAAGKVFTGGEPLGGSGRLSASDFSAILKQQWHPFYLWVDVDRLYAGVWQAAIRGIQKLTRVVGVAESRAASVVTAVALLLLCGVRWLPAAVTPSARMLPAGVPGALVLCCSLAAAGLCLTALAIPKWRSLFPLMAISATLGIAGMVIDAPWLRFTLLELSTGAALILALRCVRPSAATRGYLVSVIWSAAALLSGQILVERGDWAWARAFLVCGFFLKLAIFPMFLWLPKLARTVPALVGGMVIAVVDISAFGELYCLAQADPWILTPHGLWIAAGVSSALLASVLMLTCRYLKRLVALSSIEDFGFLILCIVCAGPLGETGALLGAAAHALGKALLFISLSSPEAAGQLDKQQGGLAACYPLSAVGFVVGMLTVLGIPPTFGFAGRWRVYEIAAQAGPALLLLLVVAEAFALIAFVRALTSVWWGAAAAAPLIPLGAAAAKPLMPRRVTAPAPPVPYRVVTVLPLSAHSASRGV